MKHGETTKATLSEEEQTHWATRSTEMIAAIRFGVELILSEILRADNLA